MRASAVRVGEARSHLPIGDQHGSPHAPFPVLWGEQHHAGGVCRAVLYQDWGFVEWLPNQGVALPGRGTVLRLASFVHGRDAPARVGSSLRLCTLACQ